jgi:hypothetical protein
LRGRSPPNAPRTSAEDEWDFDVPGHASGAQSHGHHSDEDRRWKRRHGGVRLPNISVMSSREVVRGAPPSPHSGIGNSLWFGGIRLSRLYSQPGQAYVSITGVLPGVTASPASYSASGKLVPC